MASQEPWDTGTVLPVSCTARGAAERDLFTDRECNHTHAHTQTTGRLHFIFHLAPCKSRWVSVSQRLFFFFLSFFFDHLHKYASLWWEGNCVFDGEGEWGRLVGVWVWVEGGLRTSYARQPVLCVFCVLVRAPLCLFASYLMSFSWKKKKKSLITVVCEDSCH